MVCRHAAAQVTATGCTPREASLPRRRPSGPGGAHALIERPAQAIADQVPVVPQLLGPSACHTEDAEAGLLPMPRLLECAVTREVMSDLCRPPDEGLQQMH